MTNLKRSIYFRIQDEPTPAPVLDIAAEDISNQSKKEVSALSLVFVSNVYTLNVTFLAFYIIRVALLLLLLLLFLSFCEHLILFDKRFVEGNTDPDRFEPLIGIAMNALIR